MRVFAVAALCSVLVASVSAAEVSAAWRIQLYGLGLIGQPGDTLQILLPDNVEVRNHAESGHNDRVVERRSGFARIAVTQERARIEFDSDDGAAVASVPVHGVTNFGGSYRIALFTNPGFDELDESELSEWIAVLGGTDVAAVLVNGIIAHADLEAAARKVARFVGEIKRPVLICPDQAMVSADPMLARPRAVQLGEDALIVVPAPDRRRPGTDGQLHQLRRAHQPSRRIVALSALAPDRLPARYRLILEVDDPAATLLYPAGEPSTPSVTLFEWDQGEFEPVREAE